MELLDLIFAVLWCCGALTERPSPGRRWGRDWRLLLLGCFASGVTLLALGHAALPPGTTGAGTGGLTTLEPPEQGFFSKQLTFQGIPIKAHAVVSDRALFAARDRLATLLGDLPEITDRLRRAGVELHIIGKDQVTTDLPEWRQDKGRPLAEYHGLTRDQRTRGMGGRLVSCGEENLLELPEDRYRGREILVHEFAHAIRNYGMGAAVKAEFEAQYRRSLAAGHWQGSYAASNADEFFAELSMWYFGTHGDLGMPEPKPKSGSAGLRAYDPEAWELLERFYRGQNVLPGGSKPGT